MVQVNCIISPSEMQQSGNPWCNYHMVLSVVCFFVCLLVSFFGVIELLAMGHWDNGQVFSGQKSKHQVVIKCVVTNS